MPLAPDEVPEAASLWLWLEAGEDATTAALNDNDPVVTWEDLHTSNHDVTQGTAANRPILKAGVLNGFDIVRFDGSNDFLLNGANPNLNDRSLIAVVAIAASPVNTRNSVLFVNNVAVQPMHFMARNTDANGNVVGIRQATTEFNTNDVLPADGSFHVIEYFYDPAGPNERAKIWIDTVLQLDVAATLADAGASTEINVGAGTAGSALKGDIAALAFYHNGISENSMHEVAAYFGQKYGLFALADAKGRIADMFFEYPEIPAKGRLAGMRLEFPEPTRGRIANVFFNTPERSVARISRVRFQFPLVPAKGRLSSVRLETPTIDRVGRLSSLFFLLPDSATRGRISGVRLVTPAFNRIGRIGSLRLVLPSPAPGTGGPLPDTPDNPGGIDPDTGRPVLIEFNRMLPVIFTTAPDSPRGKQSWAHTGGVQARSVASAGMQWIEEYQPRYMTDQELWAFVAYCRDLAQNERLFMIKPTEPLRSTVFGSFSGTPVVAGSGQTGYNLTTAGWTGTLLAGNLVQIAGIHTVYELVTDATSANPVLQINPQIRQGGEPADGAQLFLGPDVRVRAKIDTIGWPDIRADETHLIGLRIGFRECP